MSPDGCPIYQGVWKNCQTVKPGSRWSGRSYRRSTGSKGQIWGHSGCCLDEGCAQGETLLGKSSGGQRDSVFFRYTSRSAWTALSCPWSRCLPKTQILSVLALVHCCLWKHHLLRPAREAAQSPPPKVPGRPTALTIVRTPLLLG